MLGINLPPGIISYTNSLKFLTFDQILWLACNFDDYTTPVSFYSRKNDIRLTTRVEIS